VRSLPSALILAAALVAPAWAQDEEPAAPAERAPAAESAAGANGGAKGMSRREALRLWHAKRQAILARKAAEREAAERQAAEAAAAEAAAKAAPAPSPAAAAPQDPFAPKPATDESKPAAPPLPAAAPGPAAPPAAPGDEHAPAAPAAALEAHAPAAPAAAPAIAHAPAAPAAHGSADSHGADHGEAHGGHEAFSVGTFIAQLINFGVLLFILIFFGLYFRGGLLNKFLRGKHDQLKGDIDGAARLRDEAQQKSDAQAKRIAELEQEVAHLRETMRQDAEREQTRMLEAARVRAQQMQEDMRNQIEAEVKLAAAELRAEAARAAVALAEAMVRQSVGFEDERRLAREFVAGFAGSPGPGGEGR
jgi:F0F1-type ATP synthase membrane subunit b/b'